MALLAHPHQRVRLPPANLGAAESLTRDTRWRPARHAPRSRTLLAERALAMASGRKQERPILRRLAELASPSQGLSGRVGTPLAAHPVASA